MSCRRAAGAAGGLGGMLVVMTLLAFAGSLPPAASGHDAVPLPHALTHEERIPATEASVLDLSGQATSDVSAAVREKDGTWTPPVGPGETVRVRFARALDAQKDITILARVVAGAPQVDVYERGGARRVAAFPSVVSGRYQKTFLPALEGSQDTFDLRVEGGSVEFDHITDPNITTGIAHDVDIAILNETVGLFVIGWCDDTDDAAWYQVMYTNGSSYRAAATADAASGNYCRVAVTALNESSFVVAEADWSETTTLRVAAFDIEDHLLFSFVADANIAANVDVGICAFNQSRYAVAFVDDQQDDATGVVYDGVNDVSGQVDIDGNVAPDTTGANLVECAALNATSFVIAYFDDAPDDVAYVMANSTGNATLGRTPVTQGSLLDGGASVAALANGGFVIAYCDSTGDDVSFSTFTGTGENGTVKVDIDPDITSCNGSSGTKIDVTGLNTSDSRFAVVYDSATNSSIRLAVYDYSGNQILAPVEIAVGNVSDKAVAIAGSDPVTGRSVCKYAPNTVILAYNNQTETKAVWRTFYTNGTEWDGACNETVRPAVVLLSPPQKNISNTSVNFNVSVLEDNPLSGVVQITQTGPGAGPFLPANSTLANSSGVWGVTLTQSAGNYEAKFFIKDIFGNINLSVTSDYTVNPGVPNVTLLSPANASHDNTTISFNVSVLEFEMESGVVEVVQAADGAKTNYTLANRSGNWGTTNTSIAEGSYSVQFFLNDSAGSMNASVNVTFVVARLPRVTLLSPANATHANRSVGFNATVLEESPSSGTLEITQQDGAATNYTLANASGVWGYTNASMPDGVYRARFHLRDTAGNSNTSVNVTFTIDNAAPTISLLSPLNRTYNSTTVELNATATESISVWLYSLDNGANATFTPNTTITVSNGSHNISVYGNDSGGNIGSAFANFSAGDIIADCDTDQDPLVNLNWNVTKNTVCTVLTVNLSQNRTIFVSQGAMLTLSNVTVNFNTTLDASTTGIAIVLTNGILNMTNGSSMWQIGPTAGTYVIKSDAPSRLHIRDSTLSGVATTTATIDAISIGGNYSTFVNTTFAVGSGNNQRCSTRCLNVSASHVNVSLNRFNYFFSLAGVQIMPGTVNVTVVNNTFKSRSAIVASGDNHTIRGNTITNGDTGSGITGITVNGNWSVIQDNSITLSNTLTHTGISVTGAFNRFINNTIRTTQNATSVSGGSARGNTFVSERLISSGRFDIRSSEPIGINNSFVNVSINMSAMNITSTTAIGILWFLDVNVSFSANGSPVTNAQVDIFNISLDRVGTANTSDSGFIATQNLTEFTITSAGSAYQTNYTVNVTYSGYAIAAVQLNITNSTQLNVQLSPADAISPNVTLLSPANATHDNVTINFNVSVIEAAPGSGVLELYQASDGAFTNYSLTNQSGVWGYTNSSIAEGAYTARFYINDSLGNVNSSVNVTFTVRRLPKVILVSPSN
ncbi:MAG: hypothetical protein HY520_03605, partial [Candidatus Aenigmarchaeota archaeon]|nr:hypothetical protein [Candidatus Aenigmarchaeota archaeon]